MTTVGAAVHIHLEETTQTRLVCVCVWGGGGGGCDTYIRYLAKPVYFNYGQAGVLLTLAKKASQSWQCYEATQTQYISDVSSEWFLTLQMLW